MSQIKKFVNGKGWRVFGETNTNKTANGITTDLVDDENNRKSVQQVLEEHEALIKKLTRNISWLALHGGGGSGTGTGGSSSRPSATITLNGQANGSRIPINENENLTIQITDKYPSDSSWSLEITVDNEVVKSPFIESIYTLQYTDIKKYIDTNKNSNHSIQLKISYKDDLNNIPYNEITWYGYIYIANLQVQTTFNFDKIGCYDIENFDDGAQTYTVLVQTPLTGDFRIDVKCTYMSTPKTYSQTFSIETDDGSEKTITVALKDIFADEFASAQTDFSETLKQSIIGIYQCETKISKIESGKAVATTTDTKTFGLCGDDIVVGVLGLNYDSTDPTILNASNASVTFNLMAFKANGNNYQYKVSYVQESNETTLISYSASSTFTYGQIYEIQDLYIPATVYDTPIQIKIYVLDGTDEKYCSAYVQISQSSNTYYDVTTAKESLRFDFNAITGDNVNEFNLANMTETKVISTASSKNRYYADLTFHDLNKTTCRVTDATTGQPSIRFGNECWLEIPPQFHINSATGSTDNLFNQAQFSIHLAFKSDTYVDDEHTVFAYGTSDGNGKIKNGFAVNVHGVYINGSKVLDITDGTKNIIDIVYCNETGTNQFTNIWNIPTTGSGYTNHYVKIYLDGVLSYVTNESPFTLNANNQLDTSDCKIYVGGVLAGMSSGYFCNCNIYSITIYDKVLSELELLALYINSRVQLSYDESKVINSSLKSELRKINLCYDDTDTGELNSHFLQNNDSLDFSKIFTNSTTKTDETKYQYGVPPISHDEYLANSSIASYIDVIPVPIVYMDVYNSDTWTLENFIKTGDSFTDLQATGNLYYWDTKKNSEYAIKADQVTFEIQGTSTKSDYIKNINITMNSDIANKKEDLLVVNDTWVPERTFTLKADVVDSSHANNASIGKFINNTFVDGETEFGFGFDSLAIANMNETKNGNVQSGTSGVVPNASLKHTIEGFPVMMFIRFGGTANAKFVGIYSFNLGRDAIRNMGYSKVTSILSSDNETQIQIATGNYPAFYKNCTVEEERTTNSYWIEAFESTNFSDIAKLDGLAGVESEKLKKINPKDSLFWQSNEGMINHRFEVRYDYNFTSDPTTKPYSISKFATLVYQITRLPIESTLKSSVTKETDGINYIDDIKGEYYPCNYTETTTSEEVTTTDPKTGETVTKTVTKTVGSITQDTSQTITMGQGSAGSESYNALDITHAQQYFVIAMLFGLKDNFEKNISFRSWNNKAYLTEFYDLDTSLGINNTGATTVSPALWIKHLYNDETSEGYQLVSESYDSSKDFINSLDQDTTPESYSNKLWLSIDTKFIRSLDTADSSSKYGTYWFKLRNKFDKIASENGYDNFVDYFVDDVFTKQIQDCGSILYNADYKMKYLNLFDHSDSSSTSDAQKVPYGASTNTLSKLHGKRKEYTRRWLREHIDFLDTLFYWRMGGSYGVDQDNYTYLNTCIDRYAKFTAQGSCTYLEVKVNQPLILRSWSSAAGWIGNTIANKTSDNETSKIYFNVRDTSIQTYLDCLKKITYVNLQPLDLTVLASEREGGKTGADYSEFEQISLDGNGFSEGGMNINVFKDSVNTDNVSKLKRIYLRNITSGYPFGINLTTTSFQNVIEIDINNSTKITSLQLNTKTPLKSLNVTNSGITNLNIQNQIYIPMPSIAGCTSLAQLIILSTTFTDTDGAVLDLGETQSSLTTVSITDVKNLKKIKLSKCPILSNVLIQNCPDLEEISIDNCPYLVNGENIQIYDNENLKTLSLQGLAVDYFRWKSTNPGSLESLSIANSNIYYMRIGDSGTILQYTDYVHGGTTTSTKTTNTYNVLDLKTFENLTSFDATNDSFITHIRFRNTKGNPFKLITPLGSSGMKLTNLMRLFGNIEIKTINAFYDCRKFSIFGIWVPATWRTKTVSYDKTIWDMVPEITLDSETQRERIQSGYYSSSTFDEFDTGDMATNMFISDVQQSNYTSTAYGYCTSMTWFDVYYMLYKVALHNYKKSNDDIIETINEETINNDGTVSVTTKSVYTYRKIRDLTHICYNGYAIYGQNQRFHDYLSNKLFLHLNGVTYFWNPFCQESGTVHLPSPTSGKDDGLFSPLTDLTGLGYLLANTQFDNEIFKRTNGNYKITYFNNFSRDTHYLSSTTGGTAKYSMDSNFFKYMPNLDNIEASFKFNANADKTRNNIGTIRIPSTVTRINGSFQFVNATGTLDLTKTFDTSKDNQLSCLSYSFNCRWDGGDNYRSNFAVLLKPSMFQHLKHLVFIGTNSDNDVYNVSLGTNDPYCRGCTRYIVKDADTNGTYVNDTYTTTNWNTFTGTLFSGLTSLRCATGILRDATFAKYNLDPNAAISFPGTIFDENQGIRNIARFMEDCRFQYTLDAEKFERKTNLTNVAKLFRQMPSYPYIRTSSTVEKDYYLNRYDYGIKSYIPYKLFYHGMAKNETTQTIYGLNDSTQPMSYSDFMYTLRKMHTGTTSGGTLSQLITQSKLVQGTYNAYTTIKSLASVSDSIKTELNKADITSVNDTLEAKRPIYTPKDESDPSSVEVINDANYHAALEAFINLMDSNTGVQLWLTNVMKVSSASATTYTFNTKITHMEECFAGNGNIQAYTGSTVTEKNQYYNPFKWKYNADTKQFDQQTQNTYVNDDSFSHNGDPSTVNTANFNNTTATKLDTSSSNFKAVDMSLTRTYYFMVNETIHGYQRSATDEEEMHYICAPDLLRYCKNSADTNVTGLFRNTSKEVWCEYSQDDIDSWTYDNVYNWRYSATNSTPKVGIHGRIPENLLKPISNVSSIAEMFKNCKMITGCTMSGNRYLIPPKFFEYAPNVKDLHMAFSGMFIPYNTTLTGIFSKLNTSATDDQRINIVGIFSNCYWFNPTSTAANQSYSNIKTISGVFTSNYISYLNGAFAIHGIRSYAGYLYWDHTGFSSEKSSESDLDLQEITFAPAVASINYYSTHTSYNYALTENSKELNTSVTFGTNFDTAKVAKDASSKSYIYGVYQRQTVQNGKTGEYGLTASNHGTGYNNYKAQ